MNLSSVIGNFNYLRYSVGISMMINAFPLIFFVRDTLGIGPASSVFTGVFFALALLLMVPSNLRLVAYNANILLFPFAGFLFALLVYYCCFIKYHGKGASDVVNFAYAFAFLFLRLYARNDIQ